MPKKILLADDSITIQKVVELTFSDGDYEVTAVNNGAKAIQKLSEMRPDIILSDIIMPEKNGYEVCEYVKSHPEFRNIPVILLTGTFEPFDPDRADKAGCDAVVTKPFESQSLIHKVEELIQQSHNNAPAAEPEPEPAALFTEPAPEPAAEPFAHDNDIFSAAPGSAPTMATEMPFDAPSDAAFGGETRAFPRMSFEEMQQMAAAPATAPEPAWNATPDPFAEASHAESPFAAEEPQQTAAEEPAWSMPEPTAEEPAPQPAAAEAAASPTGELTDEQVDRIARRVVQLMSDQVVRNIAWEVIPDLAEMVVKERIRELETEP